ncbi:uncharacterized protein TRAVEDRAFT_75025 [Trametes versicolor FP-101664 SS1]|uniref:uncharacterized protein n=1 Tax=Trametes versicolor (strain FP-101664) TaxID=717944 RepID=UPI0004623BAB|nr:uncharacterized protein TRAVEDRAFT_75025 [Trametes versicolor FP-101664 SS1]EIW52688.1 hypothetical protein TRAVEDRAFT_75025 [Trametes versicolor FP-101664 SS1]
MRFSASTLAYLVSALVSALAPRAAQAGVTAFSGGSCDGDAGLDVPCDGSCHQFDERHSFRVDGGTGTHCVTVFVDPGCPRDAMGFEQSFFKSQTGQCTNVNTGTNARSFLCAPDSTCLLGAA